MIVAHSQELAEGIRAEASQMSAGHNLAMAAAGGTADGGLGTSLEKIQQAVDEVDSVDGVLILADLGSAVMTAQMLLEMLPPERRARTRLSGAPLVEGAIAAAVAAAQGADLDRVQQAAEAALQVSKIPAEGRAAPLAPGGLEESVELVVPNPTGLHARPASTFVHTASGFASHITVQNLSQQRPPVDAKSMMQVASQGTARQGERIRIAARGEDAARAIAALQALVESGFGEMDEQATPLPEPPATLPSAPRVSAPSRLEGIGASEGCAVAPAFIYRRRAPRAERRPVSDPQVEVERLREALETARRDLETLRERLKAEVGGETARVFEFHRMMLQDCELVDAMIDQITGQQVNAEAAASDVLVAWATRFAELDDALMPARAADVRDVHDRLLAILEGESEPSPLPGPVIVVAEDLEPSQTALLDLEKVRGLATAFGGATSHTAILARTRGIPAVVGLGEGILAVQPGTTLALDGQTGRVEVDPSPEAAHLYRARQAHLLAVRAEGRRRAAEPVVTRDGRRVGVLANIGDVASAQEALRYGAEGVGLLRTEFLYLGRTALPDEEEQHAAYRAIAETLGQRPLIVRTLDVGGDKRLPYLPHPAEMNPSLGLRGIRLSLEMPQVFHTQLRAILRAAVGHNVKVMFPMVTTRDEIVRAKEALAQAAASLPQAGEVEVGIMVETPAAALGATLLASEVDFFSIGSNDLAQYTLACDRTNERLRRLYQPLDPTVLRLIRLVIGVGHRAGKRIALCGELAGQCEAIPILLGLGLTEFSMAPRAVPAAKCLIRQLDGGQAQALAEEAVTLASAAEVAVRVARFLEEAQAGEEPDADCG